MVQLETPLSWELTDKLHLPLLDAKIYWLFNAKGQMISYLKHMIGANEICFELVF